MPTEEKERDLHVEETGDNRGIVPHRYRSCGCAGVRCGAYTDPITVEDFNFSCPSANMTEVLVSGHHRTGHAGRAGTLRSGPSCCSYCTLVSLPGPQ